MKLKIDKSKVKEGDIVEVSWKGESQGVTHIILDNGYKSTTLDVDSEGFKKFRINRCANKQTTITLESIVDGKTLKQVKTIKVVTPKQAKEQKYDSYQRLDKPSFKEKMDKLKLRFRYFWQSQSPQKKQAYILLWIIFAVMIISSFYPKFVFTGLLALSLYLTWTLYKK